MKQVATFLSLYNGEKSVVIASDCPHTILIPTRSRRSWVLNMCAAKLLARMHCGYLVSRCLLDNYK